MVLGASSSKGRGGGVRKTKMCKCTRCTRVNPNGVSVSPQTFDDHRRREQDQAVRREINTTASVPPTPLPSSSRAPPGPPTSSAHAISQSAGTTSYEDAMDVDDGVGQMEVDGMGYVPFEEPVVAPLPHAQPVSRRPSIMEEADTEPIRTASLLPDESTALCLGPDDLLSDASSPAGPPPPTPLDSPPSCHAHCAPPSPLRAVSSDAGSARTPSPLPEYARTAQGGIDYLKHPELLALPREPPRDYPTPLAPPYEPFRGSLADAYQQSHDYWYIRVFFALGAFLRAKYTVSLAALSYLFATVHQVFSALLLLRAIPGKPRMHQFKQARTVLKRISPDVEPTVYPVCPKCHYIAPYDASDDCECPRCNIPLFAHRSQLAQLRGKKKVPVRQWSYTPLSQLLSVLLSDDDIQAMIEKQSRVQRTPGEYHDTLDGNIMRDLRDADGNLFFGPRDDDELRVGGSMAEDGFDPFTSAFRESYSTGAFSFAITNLEFLVRYKYLLVPTLIPGPKEANCAQLQNYIALIVDDLLMLFYHGILVYSKKYPNGRRVRFALILVICDHPAMCRVCGFADHAHGAAPCTKCKVSQDVIGTVAGITQDFELRDGAEHRLRALEWLESDDRTKFYETHGIQWFELARLPYFDPIRMTVIGPMHCLLNGLVKNQWYSVWIQSKALRSNTEAGTKRELDHIHAMLRQFEAAPWIGRLPTLLGEPAGGSLTSDEWMNLSTSIGPAVLPPVWHELQPAAEKEVEAAATRYRAAQEKHVKAKDKYLAAVAAKEAAASAPSTSNPRRGKKPPPPLAPSLEAWLETNPPPREPATILRRNRDEMPMFLSLSTSLSLLLSRSLADQHADRGNVLLRKYLCDFGRIYGGKYIKYNNHWAMHIAPQIPDFGPVYGFWEYPGERVNKTLKNIPTNNHRGGEMEKTMLREFLRKMFVDLMLQQAEAAAVDPHERAVLALFTSGKQAVRGTVDAIASFATVAHENGDDDEGEAAQESDTGNFISQLSVARGGPRLQVATATKAAQLSAQQQTLLVSYYTAISQPTHLALDSRQHARDSVALSPSTHHYPFIILDGRYIYPADKTGGSAGSTALIKVRLHEPEVSTRHGELVSVFLHSREGVRRTFALVRLFRPRTTSLLPDDWNFQEDFPELDLVYSVADCQELWASLHYVRTVGTFHPDLGDQLEFHLASQFGMFGASPLAQRAFRSPPRYSCLFFSIFHLMPMLSMFSPILACATMYPEPNLLSHGIIHPPDNPGYLRPLFALFADG